MGGVNSGNDLLHDRGRSLQAERAFTSQKLVKRLAFNVFHNQEQDAVSALAKIGYINNVGMTNGSSRARLAFESGDSFAFLQVLVGEYVGANCLDGDLSGHQVLIASQINLAHGAAAQTFFQQVSI
jgi:hypothetical protein